MDHLTHPRGQAVIEMALVLPLLVTVFLFGMFFTELIRAKLKLLEAARFAGFEMTSHVLDDYGGSRADRHDRAFDEAMQDTVTRTTELYADLDSITARPAGGLVAGYSGVSATLENKPVVIEGQVRVELADGLPMPLGRLSGSSTEAFKLFDFDQKGRVQVELAMRLDNRLLPRSFLDGRGGPFKVDQWGGRNLQAVALKSRFSLIASGWALPDGSDAQMQIGTDGLGAVAGVHPSGKSMHGLWLQVDRMTHLRARPEDTELLGLKSINAASFILPKPYHSTYVVSHNYGLPNGDGRGCDSRPGETDPAHPAPSGMNNLAQASELDHPWRKCYDTAPFRDQSKYDASMSVQQFKRRGSHFMGCIAPQADDASFPDSTRLRGDLNRRKVPCEP
jgi:hypothetical protein